MARKANEKRLQELYHTVDENPGVRAGFLARILGLHRSQVTRSLPTLEEHGYYLSEDERGQLWTFHHSGREK